MQALERRINAPITTSAGRLFDAVASIVGLRQLAGFEGQAAMMLEWAADEAVADAYPFEMIRDSGSHLPPLVVDWEPMIRALLADVARGSSTATMAARFHETLARMIVTVARGRRLAARHPVGRLLPESPAARALARAAARRRLLAVLAPARASK
jgi:hydrogenase maturation protein HypF